MKNTDMTATISFPMVSFPGSSIEVDLTLGESSQIVECSHYFLTETAARLPLEGFLVSDIYNSSRTSEEIDRHVKDVKIYHGTDGGYLNAYQIGKLAYIEYLTGNDKCYVFKTRAIKNYEESWKWTYCLEEGCFDMPHEALERFCKIAEFLIDSYNGYEACLKQNTLLHLLYEKFRKPEQVVVSTPPPPERDTSGDVSPRILGQMLRSALEARTR
jgi:hypothetical protein